jgi:hypothetical protein
MLLLPPNTSLVVLDIMQLVMLFIHTFRTFIASLVVADIPQLVVLLGQALNAFHHFSRRSAHYAARPRAYSYSWYLFPPSYSSLYCSWSLLGPSITLICTLVTVCPSNYLFTTF